MAVKKVGEEYRCNICGNEVVVIKVGGGELVCCGKPMEKIEEKEKKEWENLSKEQRRKRIY